MRAPVYQRLSARPPARAAAGVCRRAARGLARDLERAGLALVLLAAAASGPAQVNLPDFGDASAGTFTSADDRQLGEAFMRAIRASVDVLEDPVIERYVQSLGYDLSSKSDYGASSFTFFVVKDANINAFAGPGGYIGVHTGLILAAENESELASVMAHEIAHVTQRHIARAIEMAGNQSIPVMAGLLAGLILGLANPDAGAAAVAAVQGASIQKQLDFTRSNELEADRVGMQMLAGAGYDPAAMPAFFEKLQTATRYLRKPPEYLSTHPVTSNRIADTRSRADQYKYVKRPPRSDFYVVQARTAVLTARDVNEVTALFASRLETDKYTNLAATAYGWGLGLLETGKAQQAREVFAKLVENHPAETAFVAAQADAAMAAGDVKRALAIYEEGLGLYPDDKVLVVGYIQALLRARRGRDAKRIIDDYARGHELDASMYKLSAEASQQEGRVAEAQLALAEHFYLSGNLGAALHHLRLANASKSADYYVSSRAAARLRELEREQALSQKRR